MKKRVFLWLFLVILLSSQVYALNPIELSHRDYKSVILPDGEAIFYMTIENNQGFEDTFRVVKPGIYWSWLMEAETIKIPAGKSEKIKVSLTPYEHKDPGNYGVLLDVESMKNSSLKESELFEILVVSYERALLTELISSGDINPNKENLFRVEIKNNYDIEIENLTLELASDYFLEEKKFVIRPYETLKLGIPVEFEGNVQIGDNIMFLNFYHNDELVLEREETINIGYYTDVSGVGTPEEGFLYNTETVVRTNEGNTISHEIYMKRLSFFEKLFTSTTPNPDEVTRDDGSYILVWNFDLNPDQTNTIIINTDYRWFVLAIILAILLAGGLYYLLRRDLSLTKKVVSMKKGSDGFYSLNVVLSLKNKTLKNIKNIKVMDRLGGRVEDTYNFGTVEPKIFKGEYNKATKLVWNLPVLGKREEIILQYTMKYKPYIIKSVPPAIAKYFSSI
jgi:hypothetical protein